MKISKEAVMQVILEEMKKVFEDKDWEAMKARRAERQKARHDKELADQKARHDKEAADKDAANAESAARMKKANELIKQNPDASPAEILLHQYDGDVSAMPDYIQAAYKQLKASDEKAEAEAAELAAAEDKSDQAMQQAAQEPEAQQQPDLMSKAKVFMAAVDHVNKMAMRMHDQNLKASLTAVTNGDTAGYQKAQQQVGVTLQFIQWFGDTVLKATTAGWDDEGASWDDVIEKAKKFGFQG